MTDTVAALITFWVVLVMLLYGLFCLRHWYKLKQKLASGDERLNIAQGEKIMTTQFLVGQEVWAVYRSPIEDTHRVVRGEITSAFIQYGSLKYKGAFESLTQNLRKELYLETDGRLEFYATEVEAAKALSDIAYGKIEQWTQIKSEAQDRIAELTSG